MKNTRVGKPYAQALYYAAVEQDVLDNIIPDTNQVIELARGSEDFDRFIANPIVAPQFKIEIFQQLFSEVVHPLLLNFLLLLASKQRERFLVSILQTFLDIVDLKAGRVVVQVTSAVRLNDEQQASLTQQLNDYSGKEVRLALSEDATIKGGIIVRLGDTVFDASITAQLQRMRRLLARG